MKQRILVTGGAGFIGSHLVDRLQARGDAVVVVDDGSGGPGNPLPREVQVVRARIQDAAAWGREIGRVDKVFHLAALISGYDSLNTPDAYFDANLTGLLRVLEYLRDQHVPRIVFASSSTVYGNSPAPLRTELDLPAPVTTYALSKLAGEHLLAMYAALFGFTHTSLRLFNVYGPRQSADHPYANVTCKFAAAAAANGRVQLYGDGAQTRDFVFVDDVVDAFLAVEEHAELPVYNVGTGADTSIASLLARATAHADGRLEVERLPASPNDIRAIRADTSRLSREKGWAARVAVDEGFSRTVQWFRRT